MPSFLTSSSANRGRGLSRINSLQRKWDDDDSDSENINSLNNNNIINNTSHQQQHPSSSQPLAQPSSSAFSWSPSPERERRKVFTTMPVPAPLPALPKPLGVPGESPQERRRRAILAAMSQPTPSTSEPAHRPLVTSKSLPSSSTSSSSRVALPELPSLPVKRPRAWEEDMTSKKVAAAGELPTRTNSSKAKITVGPTVTVKGKIFLSAEQKKVLSLVVDEGKNIFFTGSAGTGKSVLLREIISALRKKYAKTPDAVAVTASTGIAACNIGGVTLHSFGGCGLALEDANELVRKIKMNRKAATRWTRTKVLIVDEVSMVDGELFDKFNKVGRILRRKMDKPFGGIQIIVTGDFFQLPPVTKGNREPSFCFEAETWNETIDMSVNLTKVFRQSDQRFVNMLNEMRFGRLSPESIQRFKELERPIVYEDGIAATELFPRREDVDRSNTERLKALNTDGWSYQAVDGGALQDRSQREKLLSNFMAPASIFLKVDAQVMLIKNVDETLVNGSMGKVVGFCHRIEFVVDSSGRWREGGIFEEIEAEGEEVDEKRQKLMDTLKSKIAANTKPYPVVRFNVPGGQRDMLVEPDTFKTEQANGEIQVSRSQLPLILAWAMSIHKAQGQTLDRVKVDLSKVFEKGQAYVALSRATSLDGLEVRGFRPDKVLVHKKVATWSETLTSLDV